jgi:hypothetical protein
MARGILLVLSNPVTPEQEDDFNRWYDEVHLPEILQRTGFTSAHRYELSPDQLAGRGGAEGVEARLGYRYAAIYEVEGGDIRAAAASLSAVTKDLGQGAAMDYAGVQAIVLEELHGH